MFCESHKRKKTGTYWLCRTILNFHAFSFFVCIYACIHCIFLWYTCVPIFYLDWDRVSCMKLYPSSKLSLKLLGILLSLPPIFPHFMWVLGIHTQFLVLVQQALLFPESSPQPPVHFSCISMKSDHTIMSLPSGDVSLCYPVWTCISRTHIKAEDIVSHSGVMQHTHLLTPYMATLDQSIDTTKVQLGEPVTSVVVIYRNMDARLLTVEVTHRQLHYQGPPQ